MSDNLFDDDFVRMPGAMRPDMDAAFDEARQIHDHTAPEVHDKLTEAAAAYSNNGLANSLLSDSGSAILVEDPKEADRINQLANDAKTLDASSAANQALKQANQQELGQATGLGTGDGAIRAVEDLTNQATGKMAGEATSAADALKAQSAPKPTELESALSAVRLNKDRQQRFVVTGDPAVTKVFNDKLAARGHLHFSGGVAVITVSRAKALKTLQEAAREVHGPSGDAVHALSLKLNREGGGEMVTPNLQNGIISSLRDNVRTSVENFKAGALNALARKHEVDVVVVGKPEHIKEKLAELGQLTLEMANKGHLAKDSVPLTTVDAKTSLKLPEDGGPVKLAGTAELQQVVSQMKLKVDAFQQERLAVAAELKAHDENKKLESMAASKAKAGPESAEGKPEKVNEHTAKLVGALDLGFKDTHLLHTNNGGKQVEAVALLNQFRDLKDPTVRELQTIPEGDRQKAIVQLTALVQKVDSKEFGESAAKSIDKHKADTQSVRQKVDAYVAMEAARDPDFGKKMAPVLQDLLDRKAITEPQATAITEKLAKAVEAEVSKTAPASGGPAPADGAKAEAKSTATPATEAAAGTAPIAAAQGATLVDGKDATQATASKPDAATTAPSLAATSGASAGTSEASSSTTVSAAQSAAIGAAASDSAAKSPDASPAYQGGAVGAEKSAAPAPSQDSGQATLRNSIEQLASRTGQGSMDETQAYVLVASLDAIRTKPLSTLDAGSGNQPTQTLEKLGTILKEMESGRMGDELKTLAKDLAEPVQRWVAQDVQRAEKEGVGAPQGTTSDTGKASGQTELAAGARSGSAPDVAVTGSARGSESGVAPATEKVVGPDAAVQAAKEQAAQRTWETESAGAKLSQLMSNPPGSFTNRDKSWNEANIQKAAQEVLRIDPEAVANLSAGQRTKAAAYSVWMAENASSGKLPGFNSPEGKELAGKLVERATSLVNAMEAGSTLPKDVQTHLTKADNMVSARLELDRSASTKQAGVEASQATTGRSISPQAAAALAKDLVHSVYRQPDMPESQAKYLLKNAANLTPDAIKSMEPQLQAKTAVALSTLTEQVRNGAMGDVALMPTSVQKNLSAAEGAADKLVSALSKDPVMKEALSQAQGELTGKSNGAAKTAGDATSTSSTSAGASAAPTRTPGKSGGQGMER